jgi:hypothetical protein
VDEPDKVWKLSGEPRAIVLQSLGSSNSWILDCPTATVRYVVAASSLLHHYRPLYDWLKERPGRVI